MLLPKSRFNCSLKSSFSRNPLAIGFIAEQYSVFVRDRNRRPIYMSGNLSSILCSTTERRINITKRAIIIFAVTCFSKISDMAIFTPIVLLL